MDRTWYDMESERLLKLFAVNYDPKGDAGTHSTARQRELSADIRAHAAKFEDGWYPANRAFPTAQE